MKKHYQNVTIRAICMLVLGVLLIVYAASITRWIVMLCGIAFIVPGLVAIISNLKRDPDAKRVMLYPVIGLGSVLFGAVLLLWPSLFINAMMYILAACLMVVAATQLYTLWDMHRGGATVSGLLYVAPILQLAGGLYICFTGDKGEIAGLPIIIIGAGFILYALLEMWTLRLIKGVEAQKTNLLADKPQLLKNS